jgi:hypothetical protein
MKLQRLVWFSAHCNPFVVSPTFCLNLECSCRDVWLRLTEVEPGGHHLPDPMTFEVRVGLEHWIEREPPERSGKIGSLIRELMVEFPTEAIEELVEAFKQQRATQRRIAEYQLDIAEHGNGELVCYSDVVHRSGGLRRGGKHGFFLTCGSQDYLIEDHYCPTPDCDCRVVHFEFWKRTVNKPKGNAPRRVGVTQQLMGSFTFDGQVREVRFSEEDSKATRNILAAWGEQCRSLREELESRYQQIKAIGRRSLRRQPQAAVKAPMVLSSLRSPSGSIKRSDKTSDKRIGRNDRCPCGSGRKYKRCCARQAT